MSYKAIFKKPKKGSTTWHYNAQNNLEKYFTARPLVDLRSSDIIKTSIWANGETIPQWVLPMATTLGNLTNVIVITKDRISPQDGQVYQSLKGVGRVEDLVVFNHVLDYIYKGFELMVEREKEAIEAIRRQRQRSGKKLKRYDRLAKERVLRRINDTQELLDTLNSARLAPPRLRLYLNDWVLTRAILNYRDFKQDKNKLSHAKHPAKGFKPNKVLNPWD